jgi:hypothetical protein
LFKEHEAALTAITPTPCRWIKTIVRYRNDLTHHPAVEETREADRLELLQCIYVLRALLEFGFLRSISLDAAHIQKLAAKCHRYQQIRERFFKNMK